MRADDTPSERTVWPLGLYFWGWVWTLVVWCDLRGDFRHFRQDRMRNLRVLPETFALTPGPTLQDFLARMQRQHPGAAD
jgi:predicted DNA-binding transcriptional regulator YafY